MSQQFSTQFLAPLLAGNHEERHVVHRLLVHLDGEHRLGFRAAGSVAASFLNANRLVIVGVEFLQEGRRTSQLLARQLAVLVCVEQGE